MSPVIWPGTQSHGDDPRAWWMSVHSLKQIYDAGFVGSGSSHSHRLMPLIECWQNKYQEIMVSFLSPLPLTIAMYVLQNGIKMSKQSYCDLNGQICGSHTYSKLFGWCPKWMQAFKTGGLWGSKAN